MQLDDVFLETPPGRPLHLFETPQPQYVRQICLLAQAETALCFHRLSSALTIKYTWTCKLRGIVNKKFIFNILCQIVCNPQKPPW